MRGAGAGRRGGGGGGRATFPAQQRPPGDPALIARGNGLYGVHCRACHGADLRGGDQGGPNLLRSQLVLNDQAGEPAEETPVLNVLVGDPVRGQSYFASKCASCHSPSGDLQGIALRVPDPVALQNLVDGRQHVLVAVGDTLYAFVLN